MYQKLPFNIRALTRWHFLIASFFESSKYFHQIGLWAILSSSQYGLLGTLFSLAYFSANICTLEVGTAILACIQNYKTTNITQSLVRAMVIKPLAQHIIGALCVIAYTTHHTSLTVSLLTGSIALTEGMRITIRPLVYARGQSTILARGEATLSFCYILFIWLSIATAPQEITTLYLVGWYAAASLGGLIYLFYNGITLFQDYKKSVAHLPQTPIQGLFATQQSLILLHIPHHLFSANFLVPFFAHNTSLHLAGILKITSELASALKSILKSTISFPLHTLMLNYTEHRADITRTFIRSAAAIVPQATTTVLIVTGIGGVSAYLSGIFIGEWLHSTILFFIGFCILTSTDYLCMPYELLSLYRRKIFVAALIRGVEVLCNVSIMLLYTKSPLIVICGIASIRFMTWKVLVYESASAPPSFLQD